MNIILSYNTFYPIIYVHTYVHIETFPNRINTVISSVIFFLFFFHPELLTSCTAFVHILLNIILDMETVHIGTRYMYIVTYLGRFISRRIYFDTLKKCFIHDITRYFPLFSIAKLVHFVVTKKKKIRKCWKKKGNQQNPRQKLFFILFQCFFSALCNIYNVVVFEW